MIYRADCDKPHRCPKCWSISPHLYKTYSGKAHWYLVYKCPEDHYYTGLWIPFISIKTCCEGPCFDSLNRNDMSWWLKYLPRWLAADLCRRTPKYKKVHDYDG